MSMSLAQKLAADSIAAGAPARGRPAAAGSP